MDRPNLNCLFNTHNLSDRTSKYLTEVYSTMLKGLLITGLSCFVGTYFLEFIMKLFFILAASTFFLVIYMTFSQNNTNKMNLFYLFSCLEGLTISPLVFNAHLIDTTIVPSAIALTIITFGTFTYLSMYTNKRNILYFGGIASTILTVLCISSFVNLFLQSSILFQIDIYLGLVLFCFYIIYDTQMVIQEFEMGQNDIVHHAMTFYLDFLNIFIRILIILMKNSKKKKK